MQNSSSTIGFFGRANVGKSTIFNALICKKLSIVSHRANTTRQQLQASFKTDNSFTITCVDTPGITAKKGMAYDDLRFMQRAFSAGIENAQIILFVSESTKWLTSDEKIISLILEHRKTNPQKKIFWIINKTDLIVDKTKFLHHIEMISKKHNIFDEVFLLSAERSEGIEALRQKISDHWLPADSISLATPNSYYTQDENIIFHIKEAVREKIYDLFYSEIPYIVEIAVEKEKNHTDPASVGWKITLMVDRISQKKILIGRQGVLIKKIKRDTQERLKDLFGYEFNIYWLVTLKKQLNFSKESCLIQVLSSNSSVLKSEE